MATRDKTKKAPSIKKPMQISKKLPQFEGERALIIVVAKQGGRFYLANNGNLQELDSFIFGKPKYSDREGHFKIRGRGETYRSGAVYEAKEKKIQIDLVRRLKGLLKDISVSNKIKNAYLFCPDYIKNDVEKGLPVPIKKKIKLLITGNYFYRHPFVVLKKIQSDESSRNKK